MALLFLDSFDHYATADIEQKWSSIYQTGVQTPTIAAGEGRIEQCMKWTTSGSQSLGGVRYAPVLIGSADEGVAGFAIKVTNIANCTGTYYQRPIFSVNSPGTNSHWAASFNTDGTLSFYRTNYVGSTDVLLGASGQVLREAQWVYVEFAWTLHGTTGTIQCYVNGQLTFSYTGNTISNSILGVPYPAQWTGIGLLSGWSGGNEWKVNGTDITVRVDDFYLLDTSGGVNDAVWGDTMLGYIRPDGAGTTAAWTASAGSNYQCVDDDPSPDDDTSYVSTSTPNDVDTYSHEDIVAGATVKGLQVVVSAKKGADGANDLKAVVRHSGTDYASTVTRGIPTTTGYNYVTFPYDTNPGTASAWTESDVNGAQFGPKKVT